MRKTKVIKTSRRGGLKAHPSRRKSKPAVNRTTSLAAAGSNSSFPVVGIGASAGGLEAATQLLKNLPQAPGLAVVLVQHLDPTHESKLAGLLSWVTSMPVIVARNNLVLEPNCVYVIPANRILALKERRLKVSPRRDSRQ